MRGHLIVLLLITLANCSYAQMVFLGRSEPLDSLNSEKSENYLFFDFDNYTCYFTRERHSENVGGSQDLGDIWKSTRDSAWQTPIPMEMNDPSLSSPIGFTPNGQYFLYNQVSFEKQMYHGRVMVRNSKGEIKELDIPYFKNRSPIQTGSLSGDGKYLLLSLENNQGYGVDDLFVSFLKADGSWSSLRNLGITVNSEYQEISPFLAPDGRTLYYASNGQGGEGSFDIFYSERQDETWQNWSTPVNLGPAVNTSGAETSFVFGASDYAYFVSTQNSDGYGDIKRIRINAQFEEVQADSSEQMTVEFGAEEAEGVTFQLLNRSNNEVIAGTVVLLGDDSATMDVGLSGVRLDKSVDLSNLEFKSDGFFPFKEQYDLSTLQSDSIYQIDLEPLLEGSVITLSHVLFYRGTANFVEGSEEELNLVVEMMMENPNMTIFLKGHTDNVGNAMLNVELSQERVYAVEDYLVTSGGIDGSRIDGKGYGGAQPIASNEQEGTRKLNRRVEFEITKVE